MATQRIKCTSIGAFNSFSAGGTSDKVFNMDPDNGDGFSGGYIAEGSVGAGSRFQSFHVTTPLPRLSITSWTVFIGGGKNANQAFANFGMYDEAVGWRVGPSACDFNLFIWSTHTFSLGWPSPTDAQIDSASLVHMIEHRNDSDGTHPVFVNYIYSDFVFQPTGGCFIQIQSVLAPILGAGLLLKDMPGINRLLRKAGAWFSEAEFPKALRLWNEYTHPRYCFLGAH